MKVSTKGRYGVRFLMDLVTHNETKNVTLKEVAERQSISEKYLWQVVTPLKKAGLIRAVAGPGGGYTLAKPPAAITLNDILDVLEGGSALVDCHTEPSVCVRSNICAAREVWKEVADKIAEVLTSITLGDMAEKQRAMSEAEFLNYSI